MEQSEDEELLHSIRLALDAANTRIAELESVVARLTRERDTAVDDAVCMRAAMAKERDWMLEASPSAHSWGELAVLLEALANPVSIPASYAARVSARKWLKKQSTGKDPSSSPDEAP